MSQSFNVSELDGLHSEADMETEVYVRNQAKIQALAKTNDDIAFIYVMRRNGDLVEFVLDSDANPAVPGELYEQEVPELIEGFLHPSVDKEIVTDPYGKFLSGYAPVASGRNRYLVGIDMRADQVEQKFKALQITGVFSLLGSILLALVFSQYLSGHFTRRIEQLITRCAQIARERLDDHNLSGPGDELDGLQRAFDLMAVRLRETQIAHDRSHRELEKTKDELEIRVKERTWELKTANQQLRDEIHERLRIAQVLERTARTDFLTSLLNRRAMLQVLRQEAERFRSTVIPFCLVLLDLDHFKEINDTHGHDTGDAVLVYIAEQLRLWQRGQDTVCRWGGEEFLIMMPATRLEEAARRAERLRSTLCAAEKRINGERLRISGSFGVCEFGGEDTSLDECIKCADEALYRAKERGRNRVITKERKH